ncbi:trypsin-like peptidase domain-containing protein [Streptomyces sp. NPDC090994]|uniref:VMAP-C domain-containing protein n=1 Tax=Streptomyces sp. NPDC090994 TaxID=3365969 RepID=UPI003828A1CA
MDGRRPGSGFFAAPGYVVTCAHVAGSEAGAAVKVHWGTTELAGKVVAASPPPARGGLWPYPDLAIVRLTDPPAGHPCAWLADRYPLGGSPLTAVGYSDTYRTVAEPLTSAFAYQGDQTLDGGRMLRLKQDEVTGGMSGGPVLDLDAGGVCAVVKATRFPDTDMGGLATPVGALRLLEPAAYRALIRAHDLFHARDRRWPAGPPSQAAADWPAGLPRRTQCHLFGMLASSPAPAPEDLTAGFHRAAGRFAAAPDLPLHEHRDVVTELAALVAQGPVPRAVRYVADLGRAYTGDLGVRLRTWTELLSGVLAFDPEDLAEPDEPHPSAPAVRRSVMVRVRPSAVDRDRYHLAMWRYEGPDAVFPAVPETDALPLQEALDLARTRVPGELARLGRTGDDKALVEFIVPQALLEEEYDGWRPWPRRAWSRLGRKHPVIVRDLERFEDEELHPPWRRRWSRLTGRTPEPTLACNGHRGDHEVLEGWLESRPDLAALVLAGSIRLAPSTAALEVALSCGVPVVLWQRSREDDCAGAPPDPSSCFGCRAREHCPSAQGFAELRRALGQARPDQWPDRIRQLRNEAVAGEADEQHAQDLVLLWDDPGRQLPDAPLRYAK